MNDNHVNRITKYTNTKKKFIPWVEKYRPQNFDDIVLSEINYTILTNVINRNHFPNIMFYGPPGTGKTTTIINLIVKYQLSRGGRRKDLIIHLNASDERGIEIIRNQINKFVNTKSLFGAGKKFVILDEVDFMTKNAQYALRYLIQRYNQNVCFCLICNYISKIDTSLQNEFVRLKFNKLPEDNIVEFLKVICFNEKIKYKKGSLLKIQHQYDSDIRSMINYLQYNNNNLEINNKIVTAEIFEKFISYIKINKKSIEKLNTLSKKVGLKKNHFIKKFIFYEVKTKEYGRRSDILTIFKNIIRNLDNEMFLYQYVDVYFIKIYTSLI